MRGSRRVILHPHARADRVAVAEDVVHAGHGNFSLSASNGERVGVSNSALVVQALGRERRGFAAVRTIPRVTGDLVGRVRGVLEQIVLRVGCAGFHGGHFRVDGNHRVAETVEFVL